MPGGRSGCGAARPGRPAPAGRAAARAALKTGARRPLAGRRVRLVRGAGPRPTVRAARAAGGDLPRRHRLGLQMRGLAAAAGWCAGAGSGPSARARASAARPLRPALGRRAVGDERDAARRRRVPSGAGRWWPSGATGPRSRRCGADLAAPAQPRPVRAMPARCDLDDSRPLSPRWRSGMRCARSRCRHRYTRRAMGRPMFERLPRAVRAIHQVLRDDGARGRPRLRGAAMLWPG